MFKIGADPEFFLRDKSTGEFVSAHGIVPGTKRQPLPVDKGAVQVDGMALEFNIDPAETHEQFAGNIKTVLTQLREMVDPQLEFVFDPVAHFGKEYIDSQPDVAKELGCEPDYNAWTGEINPKPNSDLGFRTASGHIHIGWTNQQDITHAEHIEACQMMVKQLDFYLGVPALLWDHDTVRSSMYGAPGAYRPKHYGVEYRTLSNVWLKNDKSIRYVFNQAMSAATQLMEQQRMYDRGYDINKGNNTWSSRDIHEIVRYNIPHINSHDLSFVSSLAGTERPHIVERMRKMNEELMFMHRKTGELVSYEEATREHTHPNDYVRLCKDYKLDKPKSVADARIIYEAYVMKMTSSPAVEAAPTKKRGKKLADNYVTLENYATANSPWTSLYTGISTGNQPVMAIVDDFEPAPAAMAFPTGN